MMKYYEIWQNSNGAWLIFEVTDGAYRLVKSYKTKKGAEGWAKRTWYRVMWL